MRYDVITIGGAVEDINFYTSEGILLDNKKDVLRQKLLAFEYGAKIKIDKSYATFGGGAANTAVNFSRLGFKVAALIAVGKDERGKRILKNLKKQKVKIDLAQTVKNIESGFSFVLIGPDDEHIVFSDRAANSELIISQSEIRSLKNTKWVYIASLSGKWPELLKNIFLVPKLKIAWNPGHIQLNSGVKKIGAFLKKTSVLCLNKDEAIELAASSSKYRRKGNTFLNKNRNLLVALKSMGPAIVVITSGKQGADAYDGNKFYHQAILKEKRRVDTTGVGDAFGSSFAAGLELYDGDIRLAMKLGVKNTASVIGQQGAQNGLLSKKFIK